jgi:GSCFA family
MQFTTQIPILKSNNPIDYGSRILSLGSCFAQNMGEKFDYFKFQMITNPFGIIFNPVSIEKLLSRVVNQELFTEKDVFFYNERWHSYEVHSDLSNNNKEDLISNLNTILKSINQQLTKSTHIIITLGTAWVYRSIETNEIVANCHKVPQNKFAKELLSLEIISKSIQNTINLIHSINKEIKFIFTISPVRHIKDGFVENNVSKSNLISALYSSIIHHPSSNYFPSYEIMIDELRDYRFYAQDMLHPSQVAIDYIWVRFFENYINEKEFVTMQEVCDIQKALHHKPFNPDSESHQKFENTVKEKITKLVSQYPFINF